MDIFGHWLALVAINNIRNSSILREVGVVCRGFFGSLSQALLRCACLRTIASEAVSQGERLWVDLSLKHHSFLFTWLISRWLLVYHMINRVRVEFFQRLHSTRISLGFLQNFRFASLDFLYVQIDHTVALIRFHLTVLTHAFRCKVVRAAIIIHTRIRS